MKPKTAKPGKVPLKEVVPNMRKELRALLAADAEKPAEGEKRPMGRPTRYTPELWVELIDRLSEGEPLQQICRDEHMPSPNAVYDWTEPDRRPNGIPTTLADDFARARARGHDAIAAKTLEIADDARNDWMERHGEDSPGWALNGEHVSRSKLRIETRLKLLSKWDKRYGDKIEHTGANGGPIVLAATPLDEKL